MSKETGPRIRAFLASFHYSLVWSERGPPQHYWVARLLLLWKKHLSVSKRVVIHRLHRHLVVAVVVHTVPCVFVVGEGREEVSKDEDVDQGNTGPVQNTLAPFGRHYTTICMQVYTYAQKSECTSD